VAIVSLTAVPGALLMRQGQLLSGIAVVGISFTIVSFMEPLAALGMVFALAPLDQVFALDSVGGVGYSGSKILSVPLFLAFIANAIRGSQRIRVVPSMVLLILLYMLALSSSIWSDVGDVSLKSSTSILLLTMMIVVAITMLRNQRCLEQVMAYVVVGGAIAAMYSLLFSVAGSYQERVTVEGVNENHFSYALGFAALAACYLAMKRGKRINAMFYWAMAALLGVAILRTQSRGEIVALGGGLLAGALVGYRRYAGKIVVGLILIGCLFGTVYFIATATDFYNEAARDRLLNPMDESWEARVYYWTKAVDAIAKRPFVGHGYGMFMLASGTFRDSHNTYIKLATELGIVGLALWVSCWVILLWRSLKLRSPLSAMFAITMVVHVTLRGLVLNTFTAKATWYQAAAITAVLIIEAEKYRCSRQSALYRYGMQYDEVGE